MSAGVVTDPTSAAKEVHQHLLLPPTATSRALLALWLLAAATLAWLYHRLAHGGARGGYSKHEEGKSDGLRRRRPIGKVICEEEFDLEERV